MALLSILVLWVEIIWDAHNNPRIGGWVILTVALGAFFFRMFFKRRAWCLYVCPLGAINAIFAMPSILELRANRHLCLNRCRHHVCFGAENEQEGCPMYRHPFLVDNNRDCILCAKCIKSCSDNSIHLNLRLAPQELWDLETPRRPDSFLIVALGAILFPFALQERFLRLVGNGMAMLPFGIHPPTWLAATAVFFGLILLFEIGYELMVAIQARYATVNKRGPGAVVGIRIHSAHTRLLFGRPFRYFYRRSLADMAELPCPDRIRSPVSGAEGTEHRRDSCASDPHHPGRYAGFFLCDIQDHGTTEREPQIFIQDVAAAVQPYNCTWRLNSFYHLIVVPGFPP